MKYDDSGSVQRRTRLVEIARQVFETIPVADRQLIEQICDAVVFGDLGEPRVPAKFNTKQRFVYVTPYNMENPPLSDPAIRGIMAHEFGHACDYAERGGYGPEDSDESLERRADEYVAKWGFAADLQTARDEDKQRG